MKLVQGFILIVILSVMAFATPAIAGDMRDGSITILSPKDGSVINNGGVLRYNVHLSPNGNHLHVYIDNKSPIIDRNVSHCPCSIDLPALSPGKHVIAVKEATAAHALTGLQTTVDITVR